jgi:hypothetical protein
VEALEFEPSLSPDGRGVVFVLSRSESLLTLAEFRELALDEGACVVLMRHSAGICAVYIGDPMGTQDDLTGRGTITAALADEILDLTEAGADRMSIGDQPPYRFTRSLTHIAHHGAVIFAPA